MNITASQRRSTNKKKALLLFQQDLLRLERNNLETLNNTEFVNDLSQYIHSLHQKEKIDTVLRLLDKLQFCSCSPIPEHRERTLFLVSMYTETAFQSGNPKILAKIADLFARWLYQEIFFLSGFEFICNQIHSFITLLAPLGLRSQLRPLLATIHAIHHGNPTKPPSIQIIVNRLYQRLEKDGLLDPAITATFIQPQAPFQLVSHSNTEEWHSPLSQYIQELYRSESKDRRLELVDILSSSHPSIAEELVRLAGSDPPWYVIRNVIDILSRLQPSPSEQYILSYMNFPDLRIQHKVLAAIDTSDPSAARDKWLLALKNCKEEIKLQLLPKLIPCGGPEVEHALVNLLREQKSLDCTWRDDILTTVCQGLQHYPSIKVVQSLESFIRERKREQGDNDALLGLAQQTIHSLWAE